MNVVVVESPAKAKTINKYLGPGYTVLASYGHVRDLPAKDGSVRPDADFAMDWEIEPKASKHIKAIADAVRGAERLYLATDPDREGEAISWHVCEVLGARKALVGVDVKRVVFNEITRGAILDAFAAPRELDRELVDAYLARRALDYLVGFTLSPVLWRKLPGSRSAGRVQSVALRLVCERETEIESFRSQEYWSVKGVFRTEDGAQLSAGLTHLDGKKLDKHDLGDQAAAARAESEIRQRAYAVTKVERKQTKRNPAPPFITSTLQQEASRKLGFSAALTMRVAQRLYEGFSIGGETVGLITYMRTDGVQMAADAVVACRERIAADFGERYVPEKPRIYKSRVKNAQEAHECIRPTDINRKPDDVAPFLEPEQRKLYALIWKRTLAAQMQAAVLDQVAVDIASADRQVIFRATGSVVAFDGFLKVYREGRDDPERDTEAGEDGDRLLPNVKEREAMALLDVVPEQHFTQPPPRYTEASLVKRLEELGIGRPSTYASILGVLQDRNYVRLESKRFIPEDRGRLVTAFLANFFERYIAYGFTADMEERLDDISGGRLIWREVLADFWREFSAAVDGTKELRTRDVLDALDRALGPHFFPAREDGSDPRACQRCENGRLSIKLGKFGAFVGCSNYPECRFTRPLVQSKAENGGANGEAGAILDSAGRLLGQDPDSGMPVLLRKGPYGLYLQLGEAAKEAAGPEGKPKRVSLPRGADPAALDLETALKYLALPRNVCTHPETGEAITAGLGRFGPFVKCGDVYVSLKGDDDVLSIGANRAMELLARAGPAKPKGRILGKHPETGKTLSLRAGRYGPYVECGAVRATLTKGTDPEQVTLEAALAILAAKTGAAKTAAPQPKAKAAKAKAPGKKAGAKAKASTPAADSPRPRASRQK